MQYKAIGDEKMKIDILTPKDLEVLEERIMDLEEDNDINVKQINTLILRLGKLEERIKHLEDVVGDKEIIGANIEHGGNQK